MLTQLLKGQATMSDTQTQQGRDVAQILADMAVIRPAFQTMVGKIATLSAAAASSAGTVSPELQAQIDDLHTFAQSVAPAPVTVPPTEPTVATPPANTTPELAPTSTTSADPNAPTGAEVQI